MWQLRFFGGLASQRKSFLEASEYAPPTLHPAIESQFEGLIKDLGSPIQYPRTRRELFLGPLHAVLPLVRASVAWNTVSALIMLAGVIATRDILSASSLTRAFGLSFAYFVSRLIQASVDVQDVTRRAQINRGVQTYLFRIVNHKIAALDPTLRSQFTSGQLKTLISSDVESIEDFLSAALMQWIPTTVMTVILGLSLYWAAGWMGMLALGLALLSLPAAVVGGKMIERFQDRAQGEQDRLTTLIGEWVRNIRLVRTLGWQRAIESEISKQMRAYVVQFSFRHTIACIVYGITWSWWMVPILGMFVASAVTGQELTLEALFFTIWILNQLMNYIQHLPYSLSLYGAAVAGADRVLALLIAPELSRALLPVDGEPVTGIPVRLHLEQLGLRYGERDALDSVSASLDLNQKTAIVGSVGSGKSTLLELLVGEAIPTSGRVLVEFSDGKTAPLWRADAYGRFRSSIAYSPQQPFLSNSLIRLNVDLTGSASERALQSAAAKAQLEPDLALFPLGMEQEVGETGINLSGGQKQRVSLARAFLSARPVFVLDDPLSAVDAATETALMDAILSSAAGLVLVSHRLAELYRCDRVIVLDQGRIVEDGSPVMLGADTDSRFSAFLRALEEHGR